MGSEIKTRSYQTDTLSKALSTNISECFFDLK